MIYVVFAMCIWATTSIQIRFMISDVYSIVFWTNVVCLILCIPFIFFVNFKKNIQIILKHKYTLFFIGLFACINGITFFKSIKYTTIANALITHYMAPVIVAVISPLLLKEKFSIKIFFSLVLAVCGLLFIVDLNNIKLNSNHFQGIVYGLISAGAYAFVILTGRLKSTLYNPEEQVLLRVKPSSESDGLSEDWSNKNNQLPNCQYNNSTYEADGLPINWMITPFIYIFAQAIVAIPIMTKFTNFNILTFDKITLILIIIFGTFNVFIAAYLFYKSLTLVQANKVAIIGYIEPVGAIFISIIFLKELLTYKILIGGLLIFLSSALVSIKKSKVEC